MRFRCRGCAREFEASRKAGEVSCPGCGQRLSVKPRLEKTCPGCGAPVHAERAACPKCGANFKLAGLRRTEGDAAAPYAPEYLSLGMRAFLAVVGLAMTIAGAILCKKAWDAGWIVWAFCALVVLGLGTLGHALFTSNTAATARAAREARRRGHHGPSQ